MRVVPLLEPGSHFHVVGGNFCSQFLLWFLDLGLAVDLDLIDAVFSAVEENLLAPVLFGKFNQGPRSECL